MENETGLVKSAGAKLPKFVEQAYDSIEGMKQFANMLLESKLVPDSYYEKGLDKKPDYTKGKTSAVVIVLLQAQQLNVPPMTGLQHIVPVNGLLSIKGDLAKTMIFASGKLRKDSWKETVTGSIENEDMVVSITATREDNGITLTRTFSVDKAKRMGLWVTKQMAEGQDGWKHQKSAWYKTPDRMLNYRALGNIARDLFSDVLLNMYTTEEAVDIDRDVTEVIETESGAKIIIPDKEHSKSRSTKMTDRVADKIPDNKFGKVGNENIQEATIVDEPKPEVQTTFKEDMDALETTGKDKDESPFIAGKGSAEYMNGVQVIRDEQNNITNMDEIDGVKKDDAAPEVPGQYTLDGMEKMETPILLKIVMEDMDMMEASEIIGGKNTNKKLREIIFAHQEGKLDAHVAPYLKANEEREKQEKASAVAKEPVANTQAGEIPVNKELDKATEEAKIDAFLSNEPIKKEETKSEVKVESGNKYKIEIPAETPRDFSLVKQLFNKLMGITPQITTPVFMTLISNTGMQAKYADKEMFLKLASVEEINLLLNANK
ncbi:MAG: recombinase RecT [Prolixibacteraceae bacterium]|nr:recombinase RecT [Prolixibacteraceae bacterium]